MAAPTRRDVLTASGTALIAAPVIVSQEHLARSGGTVRAIVVNSGCANACTGDARLRVRLDEPRGGGGDVEIDRLRLLHQRSQFGGPEAAPPIQRRRRADAGRPRVLVTAGNLQRGIWDILGQDAPR